MNNQIIVIEGPDGAGKSTIAATLCDAFGLELIHTGGPIKDRQEFVDRERDLDLMSMFPRIYDRVPYISDQVYAFLNVRAPVVTYEDVTRFLETVKPVIIYCRLSTSAEMVEHISESKKAHKPPEYLEKVKISHPALVASYDKVMHDLVLKHDATVVPYNWKTDPLPSLIANVSGLIRRPF